jgi:PadR family transcriptional regulator AphA
MSRNGQELTRGEWCVLALIAEGTSHGWALSRAFAPGGEIRSYWSGDRQRVYRSLRSLEARELITVKAVERGERGRRTVYTLTPAGKTKLRRWLTEPATNVKDAHNSFLLKLLFAQRAGVSTHDLVAAQHEQLNRMVASLEAQLDEASDAERLPLRLHIETTRAVLAFITDLIGDTSLPTTPPAAARSPARARRSDLTGRAIEEPEDAVTVLLCPADPGSPTLAATAHRDDERIQELRALMRPLALAPVRIEDRAAATLGRRR